MTGNVYVRGRALGKIDAEIDAYVDPLPWAAACWRRTDRSAW